MRQSRASFERKRENVVRSSKYSYFLQQADSHLLFDPLLAGDTGAESLFQFVDQAQYLRFTQQQLV